MVVADRSHSKTRQAEISRPTLEIHSGKRRGAKAEGHGACHLRCLSLTDSETSGARQSKPRSDLRGKNPQNGHSVHNCSVDCDAYNDCAGSLHHCQKPAPDLPRNIKNRQTARTARSSLIPSDQASYHNLPPKAAGPTESKLPTVKRFATEKSEVAAVGRGKFLRRHKPFPT